MAGAQPIDFFGAKATAEKHRRQRLAKVRAPQVPVIANPTATQRKAQKELILRSLRQQGVNLGDARERAALPKPAKKALKYAQVVQQDEQYRATLKIGVQQLKGKGKRKPTEREALIAGSQWLANRPQAKEGPAPKKLGVSALGVGASINLTSLGRKLSDFTANIGSGAGGGVLTPNIFAKGAQDLISLPKGAVQSVGEIAKATHDALGPAGYLIPGAGALNLLGGALEGNLKGGGGDFKRAKAIGDALTRGPVGELVVHGDPKAALKSFEDHPLYGALDFTGAYGLVGRTAGAAGRLAAVAGRESALGRAGARLGSTAREPLRLFPGSPQEFSRSYSKNALTKALQVRHERGLAKRGLDPNVVQSFGTGLPGDIVGPIRDRLQGQRHAARGAVDEALATQQAVARGGRSEAISTTHGATRKPAGGEPLGHTLDELAAIKGKRLKPAERDVLGAVIERGVVARHPETGEIVGHVSPSTTPAEFRAGLVHERDRLERVWHSEREQLIADHGHDAAHLNRAHVQALDRVIKDPKALAKVQSIALASQRIIDETLNPTERGLIAAKGVLDKDQATAAKVRRYAIANMDARPESGLTPVKAGGRHAAAKTAEGSAKGAFDAASKKLDAAAKKRARIVGKQSSRRGTRQKNQVGGVGLKRQKGARNEGRATPAEIKELEEATAAVKVARAEKRVAKARFEQARRERVKSHPRKRVTGLVDRDGERVTTQAILEHMRANNVDVGGFLSHQRLPASSSMIRGMLARPSRKAQLSKGSRTGEAARAGLHTPGFDAVVESAVRRRGDLDNIESADRFFGQFGISNPSTGRAFTPAQADRFATKEGFTIAPGEQVPGRPVMVPISMGSSKLPQQILDSILSDQGVVPMKLEDSLGNRISVGEARVREAIEAGEKAMRDGGKKEHIILVPKEQLDRFVAHQQVGTSTAGKLGNVLTSAFRGTVLPFSTKWLTGNVAEAILRMAVNGVRPSDLIRGGRIIKELQKLDDDAWRLLQARGFGGLLYGSHDALKVTRKANQFENTSLEGVATRLTQARHTKPLSVLITGIQGFQRGVFASNKWFEQQAQKATLGKFGRERYQEFSGSWVKALRMQETAAKQVADGLLGTPEQVRFARYVDEVLGKYSRFSPKMRRLTQQAMPFLPWYLNSVRFVFHTLPTKHPVKTAILANMQRVMGPDFQQQLADAGGVPPGDLRSAIPTKDGGFLNLARYTPAGAFTGGIESIVDPVLPQLSTAYGIVRYGKSFTGRDLDTGQGYGQKVSEGKRASLALYSLIESFAPVVAISRRLQEGGETAYDDSTFFAPHTKPGTSHNGKGFVQALDRVFNPARPTYLQAGQSLTVRKGAAPAASADPMRRALSSARPAATSSSSEAAMRRALEATRPEREQGSSDADLRRQLRAAGVR